MIFTYWQGTTEDFADPPSTASWQARLPAYRVFGDSEVLAWLSEQLPQYVDLYRSIRIPACKSDIARLVLLHKHGGLYVDAHAGPGSGDRLSEIFEKLASFELVIFDLSWKRSDEDDIWIINGVLAGRRGSEILMRLIESAFGKLSAHARKETASSDYVPYNIHAMTGAWDMSVVLFDRSARPISIRPEYLEKVHVHLMSPVPGNDGVILYQFYQYRSSGAHWSERQAQERLFDPTLIDVSREQYGKKDKVDIHALITCADALNWKGLHTHALEVLLPALAIAPEHHWVNFQMARAYSGLSNRETALHYFVRAAESAYPFRVGAMYEVVKHDLMAGRFGRVGLLDEALNLPGDLMGKDEGAHQKRYYYFQILFLKAMLALSDRRWDEAESILRNGYDFTLAFNERSLAFEWVTRMLGELPQMMNHPARNFPYLEYARRSLLNVGMEKVINYDAELQKMPGGTQVLEIGAMDGIRFDPLHRYITERRWGAVVVEPLPDMFERLSENYRPYPWVRCVNVAISETTAPLTFYRVSPEAVAKHGHGEWVMGISSAIKGATLSYLGDIVTEQSVRAVSFADFVKEVRLDRIDVLQVDTEGYDWTILRQIDLRDWSIRLIQVEIINLPPPDRLNVLDYLGGFGYRYYYDGMNVTAVHRSADHDVGPAVSAD